MIGETFQKLIAWHNDRKPACWAGLYHEQCMEWLSEAAWLRALGLPLAVADSLPISRSRDVACEVANSRDHWELLVASSPLTPSRNETSTSTVLAAADWALRAVYCFQCQYSRISALLVMATPKPENAASRTANTESSWVCIWEVQALQKNKQAVCQRNLCSDPMVITTSFKCQKIKKSCIHPCI